MKRSDALRTLSHDHHDGLVTVQRLKRGLARTADPHVMADFVQHVWATRLVPHFDQEETHVLPVLRDLGGVALADRMQDEHGQLRAVVASLNAVPTRQALTAFTELLRQHIRFEERVAFPVVEDLADAETLAAIGRMLQEEPDADAEAWEPAFWA